jgi:hypothetical protein
MDSINMHWGFRREIYERLDKIPDYATIFKVVLEGI